MQTLRDGITIQLDTSHLSQPRVRKNISETTILYMTIPKI